VHANAEEQPSLPTKTITTAVGGNAYSIFHDAAFSNPDTDCITLASSQHTGFKSEKSPENI
jgi:hypothetical protein